MSYHFHLIISYVLLLSCYVTVHSHLMEPPVSSQNTKISLMIPETIHNSPSLSPSKLSTNPSPSPTTSPTSFLSKRRFLLDSSSNSSTTNQPTASTINPTISPSKKTANSVRQ